MVTIGQVRGFGEADEGDGDVPRAVVQQSQWIGGVSLHFAK